MFVTSAPKFFPYRIGTLRHRLVTDHAMDPLWQSWRGQLLHLPADDLETTLYTIGSHIADIHHDSVLPPLPTGAESKASYARVEKLARDLLEALKHAPGKWGEKRTGAIEKVRNQAAARSLAVSDRKLKNELSKIDERIARPKSASPHRGSEASQ